MPLPDIGLAAVLLLLRRALGAQVLPPLGLDHDLLGSECYDEAQAHRRRKISAARGNPGFRRAFLALVAVARGQFIQLATGHFAAFGGQHAHQIAAVGVVFVLAQFLIRATRGAEQVADDHVGEFVADVAGRFRLGPVQEQPIRLTRAYLD